MLSEHTQHSVLPATTAECGSLLKPALQYEGATNRGHPAYIFDVVWRDFSSVFGCKRDIAMFCIIFV